MKKLVFNIEIYEKKPEEFSPQVEVAACYLETQGKLLVLQRAEEKLEGGKWGVPAGKLEKGETPLHAAVRELFEETGIQIDAASQVQSLGALYIRKPEVDYVYHLFKIHIDDLLPVHLSNEHQAYAWAALQELETMPLMAGAQKALEYYQRKSNE